MILGSHSFNANFAKFFMILKNQELENHALILDTIPGHVRASL